MLPHRNVALLPCMNFEQLLDGATKGPWGYDLNHTVGRHEAGEWEESVCQLPAGIHGRAPTKQEKNDMLFIARTNPLVMREVWTALKGAVTRLSVLVAGGVATLPEEQTYKQCKRALALLDGQTEK